MGNDPLAVTNEQVVPPFGTASGRCFIDADAIAQHQCTDHHDGRKISTASGKIAACESGLASTIMKKQRSNLVYSTQVGGLKRPLVRAGGRQW